MFAQLLLVFCFLIFSSVDGLGTARWVLRITVCCGPGSMGPNEVVRPLYPAEQPRGWGRVSCGVTCFQVAYCSGLFTMRSLSAQARAWN